VLADVGERPAAQVGGRRRPDDVTKERRGARQPTELLGAAIAASEMPDDRSGRRRVTGHEPLEPAWLSRRQLDVFECLVVVHRSPCDQ
jgi:hypothetical protein